MSIFIFIYSFVWAYVWLKIVEHKTLSSIHLSYVHIYTTYIYIYMPNAAPHGVAKATRPRPSSRRAGPTHCKQKRRGGNVTERLHQRRRYDIHTYIYIVMHLHLDLLVSPEKRKIKT